jgi:hypothetical protein
MLISISSLCLGVEHPQKEENAKDGEAARSGEAK